MKRNSYPFPINMDITPINAHTRRYEFICDVVNPYIAMKELLDFAHERGFIFGTSTKDGMTHFGLYRKTTPDAE